MIAVKPLSNLLISSLWVRAEVFFLIVELFGDFYQERLALFLGHFKIPDVGGLKVGCGGGGLEVTEVDLWALVVGWFVA